MAVVVERCWGGVVVVIDAASDPESMAVGAADANNYTGHVRQLTHGGRRCRRQLAKELFSRTECLQDVLHVL